MKEKKLKMGFTGPYCTANFGDWAMLINNIYDFGDNEFYVFTYSSVFPHNALKYYSNGRNIRTCEVRTKEDNYQNFLVTPLDCISEISNIDELRKIIRDLDVLIVSGGGWIDDGWCKRLNKFYKVMAPMIIATQFNVPVRFMAQGIGPMFETKEMMRFFFNYLNEDTIIGVRDKYCSESYLKEIVNDKYEIKYVPDDLNFINHELVSKECSIKFEEPYFVLVINDSVEYVKTNIDMFSQFCKMMKKKYNLNTVLLPFDLVWFGAEQSELIHQNVKSSQLIDINNKKFISISDVVNCIKKAKLVITGRHHASVIAAQVRTPFLIKLDTGRHFYAYNKAHGVLNGFVENMQCDDSLFFSDDWSSLFNYVILSYEKIVKSQNEIFEKEAYKDNYDKQSNIRKEYIQSILNSLI